MKKSSKSIQPTLFDVPAVQKEEPVSTKKSVIRASLDVSCIGLNAVFEGRSSVYKNFTDYIHRSNLIK